MAWKRSSLQAHLDKVYARRRSQIAVLAASICMSVASYYLGQHSISQQHTSAELAATNVRVNDTAALTGGCQPCGCGAEPPATDLSKPDRVRLGSAADAVAIEAAYWRQRQKADAYLQFHQTFVYNVWAGWAAFYPCPLKERFGEVFDGGKWLCSVDQLLSSKRSCQVFSLGSSGETSFEHDILSRIPHCSITVFDPSLDDQKRAAVHQIRAVVLHEEAIGAEEVVGRLINDYSGNHTVNVTTVDAAMQRAGLDWVDVIKCDIEGFEFEALQPYFDSGRKLNATFVLMEVHLLEITAPATTEKAVKLHHFFKGMQDMGFRIYSSEPNVFAEHFNYVVSNVAEVAFINVDKDGLVRTGPG